MDFLWVRWFGCDTKYKGGWRAKQLYRVGFLPSANVDAFGFLDPNLVVRGVHLIPAFHHSRNNQLLVPSIVRPPSDKDTDWFYYYVAMYVYIPLHILSLSHLLMKVLRL